MADINVEKKGPNFFPWIIGVLVAIGLIWFAVEAFDDDTEEGVLAGEEEVQEPLDDFGGVVVFGPYEGVEPVGEADVPGNVRQFVTFVEEGEGDGEMGLEHQYTATGIERLSAALGAIVDRFEAGDVNIEQKRDSLDQWAERVQQDPTSLQHSNTVQQAFMAAADLMASLQEKRAPDLSSQVAEVQQAAQAVDPGQPLLEQQDAVTTFFERSSQVLQAMTGANAAAQQPT